MLWHIPAELKRFKEITTGHTIIMGRKTHESIGRLLPNRTNIIITRDTEYKVDGAVIVHSLEEAIEKAQAIDSKEIFVIGGGQIFNEAISLADKLYLTIVEGNFEGDVYFPDYSHFSKQIFKLPQESDGYKYTFIELTK
jgi:dihydrofolate reductase